MAILGRLDHVVGRSCGRRCRAGGRQGGGLEPPHGAAQGPAGVRGDERGERRGDRRRLRAARYASGRRPGVGGWVNPDKIVLARPSLAITAYDVQTKERMVVSVPGGTRDIAVPALLRNVAALSGEQAVEVGRLAVELEGTIGRPVDLECAYHG